jgi:hypothetical protein
MGRLIVGRRELAVILGIVLGALASTILIRPGRSRRVDGAAARPAAPAPAPHAAVPETKTQPAIAVKRPMIPQISNERATLIISAITLGIVVFQTYLIVRQTVLAQEQTRLSQRQLEIVEKQDQLLARRAQLTLRAQKLKAEGDRIWYSIVAENVGQRGARGYHWTVLVPPIGGSLVGLGWTAAESGDPVTIDGTVFTSHRGYIDLPLFPGLRQEIFKVQIRRRDPGEKIEVPLLWRIVTEDGMFPEGVVRADGSAGSPGRLILDGR